MIKIEREQPKKPVQPDKEKEMQVLKEDVQELKLVIDDLILNGGMM